MEKDLENRWLNMVFLLFFENVLPPSVRTLAPALRDTQATLCDAGQMSPCVAGFRPLAPEQFAALRRNPM
jgi:hypothetical protein